MAKWVLFKKDFDYRPNARAVIGYKKDMHLNIPEGAATAAVEGGYAEYTDHEPKAGAAKDGSEPVPAAKAETVKANLKG